MAAKELDEWTRAAERAEMRIRLKARIARLLEAAGRGRKGTVLHSQAEARQRGFPTHAGIDPAESITPPPPPRFPRPVPFFSRCALSCQTDVSGCN